MLSGWDAYEHNAGDLGLTGKVSYFSGEDDGHQVKKGWVYAVPMAEQDQSAHDDDEEKYMYFNASGEIVRDQFKKINGKYYAFDRAGIMKDGLVLWAPDGVTETKTGVATPFEYHYVNTIDLDWATGEELSKKGLVRYGDGTNDYFYLTADGLYRGGHATGNLTNGTQVKIHYFGSDGARKTGQNTVEFSDDNYTFYTASSGDKGSGTFSKKYYSLGIQLRASGDIRYGIYNIASPNDAMNPVAGDPLFRQTTGTGAAIDDTSYRSNLVNGMYQVLNTGGAKQKGQYTAKKDADGNYWFIERTTDVLRGIWSVNVKSNASFGTNFKTRVINLEAADKNTVDGWLTRGGTNGRHTASTSEIMGLTVGTNYMDATVNGELDNLQWNPVTTANSNRVYFTLAESYQGFGYQSDINDNSNKWIPFGVFDNANKTVVYQATSKPGEKRYHAYEVTPNNDYFLNCYWN